MRWNYAAPYMIAKKPDGRCVHLESSGCNVYDKRPATCRLYDCRQDSRIWRDFEKRIPAD